MSKRSSHSPLGTAPNQRELRPRSGITSTGFNRRDFLQASGALLFTASSPLFAQNSSIVAVRVWPAADYTRVTLELEAPLKFTHQVIKNPERLVVDIDDRIHPPVSTQTFAA